MSRSSTYLINCTHLTRNEFQDNLLVRYVIVFLNIPTYCDGCGKNILVSHTLSCPKGGLVMARHNYVANKWGALLYQTLNPSAIIYEPKTNNRTVQGKRNGAEAWVVTWEQEGERNEEYEGATGQGPVTDESWPDVSIHGIQLNCQFICRILPPSDICKVPDNGGEGEKGKIPHQPCLEHRCSFTDIV